MIARCYSRKRKSDRLTESRKSTFQFDEWTICLGSHLNQLQDLSKVFGWLNLVFLDVVTIQRGIVPPGSSGGGAPWGSPSWKTPEGDAEYLAKPAAPATRRQMTRENGQTD